jgi:glycerol-3-phosphate dehydrogenase (NAD(P)+)
LLGLDTNLLKGKKVVSAVKGVMPKLNILLNQYLAEKFEFPLSDYYTLLGPCHAEEVAAEQLSYLTFSGINEESTNQIAAYFKNEYINTVVNDDIHGVQYASIVKNIFALGAGIAHGLEYGDNFLSVYIANAANEMRQLLKAIMIQNEQVSDKVNYSASVYLGDLLVTCYSLHSRNRTFGNMIGKGYSVRAAELEMNMVAEGYNACKCIVAINENLKAPIPIIQSIYKILWEGMEPEMAFKEIEQILI